jgi:catechol 2,3-dioxygenase-like lactoylglutathione lyase family enzyme
MQLNHTGIISKTEDMAVRFYQNFLGMEKTREYTVTPELANQLFSVFLEMKVVTFSKDDVKVEIFICPEYVLPAPNISHFCLHLESFPEILETAQKAGVELITGQKGDKKVYFLKDFSGNMIEIKPV